ncbi:MAG: cytochrome C oxidase subunit IV family protein [Bacteroidales bacterium]|jgi:cytochrome c oxidase subunit IV
MADLEKKIEHKVEETEDRLEAQGSHHIVPYKSLILVLLSLIVLTILSVAVTSVELGPLTVTIALLLASTKALIVLIYFMHLKFDNIMYTLLLIFTLFAIISIIIITFLDYLFR